MQGNVGRRVRYTHSEVSNSNCRYRTNASCWSLKGKAMTMAVKAMDIAPQEGASTTVAYYGPSVPMGDHYPYMTPHRILSTGIDAHDPQVVGLRWSANIMRKSCVRSATTKLRLIGFRRMVRCFRTLERSKRSARRSTSIR